MTPLAPGLWWLPTTVSNAYLYRTARGRLVVVDPGLAGDERLVLDAAAGLGTGVEAIVVTHFHSDHAGAAPALAAATGAPVHAGAADAAVLLGAAPVPEPELTAGERALYQRIAADRPGSLDAPRCPGVRPLEEGDTVAELIVHAVPGHTWGSIALHLPDHAAVLTGDVAVTAPDGTVVPGPFSVDRELARRALDRLTALQPRVIGVGHGHPVVPPDRRRQAEPGHRR